MHEGTKMLPAHSYVLKVTLFESNVDTLMSQTLLGFEPTFFRGECAEISS
jgi:hypothetical protein